MKELIESIIELSGTYHEVRIWKQEKDNIDEVENERIIAAVYELLGIEGKKPLAIARAILEFPSVNAVQVKFRFTIEPGIVLYKDWP